MISSKRLSIIASIAFLVFSVAGCGGGDGEPSGSGGDLSSTIRIDGSSTLAPLTGAIAKRFQNANPGVSVTIGISGTGAGFERLCAGEADISDAMWMMDRRARELCREASVNYADIRVATNALAILVNAENPVNCLTVGQLSAIWDPGSKISRWDEIPGLDNPFSEKLMLFGPDAGTGSFEFFTERIHGVAGAIRTDYNSVGTSDKATVAGVEGASGAMGYTGFSAYAKNEGNVKALEVDNGKGCVDPSVEAAQDGSYEPLSGPMSIYLSDAALKKPEVGAFVDYYLENTADVAQSLGFVPLTKQQVEESEAIARKAGV